MRFVNSIMISVTLTKPIAKATTCFTVKIDHKTNNSFMTR